MNNKLIVIVLVVILTLSLVACGGDKAETKNTSEKNEETGEKVKEDKKPKKIKIDESLTGLELLASVEPQMADSLVMTTEQTMVDGTISTSKTYTKADNMRVESSTPYGNSVMIYDSDEGNTYQYTIGDKEGTVMNDGDDMDMDMDMSAPTLVEFTEGSTGEVIARVEELDGEKVIYIETTEDDGDGSYEVHMWYSIEYSVPLKFEVESDGQVMMSSVVTDIEYNGKIANKMFEPPSDVEFINYSMDGVFGALDDMSDMTDEEIQEMYGDMSEEELAELAEMLGQQNN
jgi:outer membrane lipoprotein-sorting protein